MFELSQNVALSEQKVSISVSIKVPFQLSAINRDDTKNKKVETFLMVVGTADGDCIHVTEEQATKLGLTFANSEDVLTRFGYKARRLEPLSVKAKVICSSDKKENYEVFSSNNVFLIPPIGKRSSAANTMWPSVFEQGVMGMNVLTGIGIAFCGADSVMLFKPDPKKETDENVNTTPH